MYRMRFVLVVFCILFVVSLCVRFVELERADLVLAML